MKGFIALDIDGTITEDKYSVPPPVVQCILQASQSGWKIALATGRAFVFAEPLLQAFTFPYFLLPQNGSIVLDMPSKEIISKHYMPSTVIADLEAVSDGFATDFVIYSGMENRDRCYYRSSKFSPEDFLYLEAIQQREKEPWIQVDRFDMNFDIPLVKFFGKLHLMKKIEKLLLEKKIFQVTLIRDPFYPSYYILLVTDIKASKGSSLKDLMALKGRGDLVIAAGDDANDMSLLLAADVRIAMPHAPENLRKIADFIAPPTSEMGIIQALKIAMGKKH